VGDVHLSIRVIVDSVLLIFFLLHVLCRFISGGSWSMTCNLPIQLFFRSFLLDYCNSVIWFARCPLVHVAVGTKCHCITVEL